MRTVALRGPELSALLETIVLLLLSVVLKCLLSACV